jgi:hypothetical protein
MQFTGRRVDDFPPPGDISDFNLDMLTAGSWVDAASFKLEQDGLGEMKLRVSLKNAELEISGLERIWLFAGLWHHK